MLKPRVCVCIADPSLHIWAKNGYAIQFYTLCCINKMCFAIMRCILSVIVCFTAQHLPYFGLIQRQKEIQFTKKRLLHLCILFGTSQETSLYVWGTSGGNLSFCTHSTRTDSFSSWLIVAVGSHQFNRTQLKKIQRPRETKGLMKGCQPNCYDNLIHHTLKWRSPFTKYWLHS